MIATSPEQIKARAQGWIESIGWGELITGESTVGGGSLPGETLPTFLVSLDVRSTNRFLKRLHQAQIPIIARVQNDRVVLDPRTVLPEQDEALLTGLRIELDYQSK